MSLILAFFLIGSAFSQESIKVLSPRSEVEVSEQPSRVQITVFKDDLPLSKVSIIIDGKSYKTNPFGHLDLSLAPGFKEIEVLSAQSSFSLKPNETKQLLISLYSNRTHTVENISGKNISQASKKRAMVFFKKIKVLEEGTNKPLKDAKVFVAGLNEIFITDEKGEVSLELPLGKSSFSVGHKKHKRLNKSVEVIDDEKNIIFKLKQASSKLEDLVVIAPQVKGSLAALIESRKASSSVKEVLSSEQIARAGDSNAASSLRRVTGLTLVNGKYVYVRGLGERYSNAQLNSLALPSPEPTKRVVPLDLFPTTMLQSMEIQKSYSPDMPGEFGGGAILMESKTMPEEFSFKLNTSAGYITSEGDSLNYQGGGTDWMGKDDGTRAMPSLLKSSTAGNRKLVENNPPLVTNGFSKEELAAIGKSLPNIYNTSQGNGSAVLPGLTMNVGDRFKIKNNALGYSASALYGTSINARERIIRDFANTSQGDLTLDSESTRKRSRDEYRLGGNLDLGAELGKNHKLSSSFLFVRHTTNTTTITEGFNADDEFRITDLEWIERELNTQQFRGEHTLPALNNLKLAWGLSNSVATRDEPDHRTYIYTQEEGEYLFSTRGDGNQRLYSNLEDQAKQTRLDLTLPLHFNDMVKSKIKVGYNYLEKSRESTTRRFSYQGDPGSVDLSQDLEGIFDEDNINENNFQLLETTRATDSYSATQKVHALYAMSEVDIYKLNLSFGVRQEKSIQDVTTYDLFDPSNAAIKAGLETDDLLPAYALTYKFTPKHQLRMSYSETLSRPDFRELSTAPYTDDELGSEVVGNADLQGAVIKNIDSRFEYYPSPGESISVGFFYKKFTNPIEVVIKPGAEGLRTFENARSATNIGAEFDLRKRLHKISSRLRHFTVATNFSLIQSEIELDPTNAGTQTSDKRPLQGQSPYVANFQLLHDYPSYQMNSALIYNVYGPRITEVGTGGAPDIIEQPFHQLDFNWNKRMNKNFFLGFKAQNLLNPDVVFKQGDETVSSYRRGYRFSLNLSTRL